MRSSNTVILVKRMFLLLIVVTALVYFNKKSLLPGRCDEFQAQEFQMQAFGDVAKQLEKYRCWQTRKPLLVSQAEINSKSGDSPVIFHEWFCIPTAIVSRSL